MAKPKVFACPYDQPLCEVLHISSMYCITCVREAQGINILERTREFLS